MVERPLLVVSPHFDDAALSCGRVLSASGGADVVTVFGGRPAVGVETTAWDRDSGFAEGEDPVGRRCDEDKRALAVFGARPTWLEFVDHQYGQPRPSPAAVTAALEGILAGVRPRTVLLPLGLEHPDHRCAAAAGLKLVERHPDLTWLVYEEGLYRAARDHDRAFAVLAAHGLNPVPVVPHADPSPDRKRVALGCYRSQLRACLRRGVPMLAEATIAERYWRLEPAARPD